MVIYTTSYIHETHYLKAEHHDASTALEIPLSEFEKGLGPQKGPAAADDLPAEHAAMDPREDTIAGKPGLSSEVK